MLSTTLEAAAAAAGDANFAPNFFSPDDCPIIIFFFGLSLSVNIGLVTLRGIILKL